MNKEPRIYGSKWDRERLVFLHKLKDALRSGDAAAISKAQKLFWSRSNWQGLCKQHHDSTKQRMEKRGSIIGCDESGIPLDPTSHWFKQ